MQVWNGSYSTGEGRSLQKQPTHLTEQTLLWLTPPSSQTRCPQTNANDRRFLVRVTSAGRIDFRQPQRPVVVIRNEQKTKS